MALRPRRLALLCSLVAFGSLGAACTSLIGDFEVGPLGQSNTSGDAAATDSTAPPSGDGSPNAPTCVDNVCTCTTPGTTLCGAECWSLTSDNAHCGSGCATATACSGETVCQNGACAPCPTGKTFCAGACVDLKNDGANCGRCGHACGGGGCNETKCVPVQIAGALTTTSATIPALPSLVVTATDLLGTYNDGTGPGRIFRIPVTQGESRDRPPLVTEVQGAIRALFFDGATLWFGNMVTPAAIYAAPLTGLANPTVMSNAAGSGTIYNLGALGGHPYWDQGTGSIYQQLGNAVASPVSITASTTRVIGADNVRVYYAKAQGTIQSGFGDLTVPGNVSQISPSSPVGFDRMATDATRIYFGNGIGLWRLPKIGAAGGPTAYFANTNGEAAEVFAPDPDNTVNRIYYMAIDSETNGARTIFAVAKDGSNNTAVRVVSLDSAGPHLSALAADGTAIYYTTTSGEVWKLVK
jgi:hypothetical protein